MASLERYAEVRRRYPDAELLMGIGNITELTAADSTGVNAMLIAICQELGVRAVLTTEVIPWARGAVREIDVARRLMHYAVTQQGRAQARRRPAGHGQGPERILAYTEAELRALQARITDPNFRIFTDRDTITVLNSERFVRGTDIQEIFAQLGVDGGDARLLPRQGAGEGQARHHARQDVPPGRAARVGLPHAARRPGRGARAPDAAIAARGTDGPIARRG